MVQVFNDVIYLINMVDGENDLGDPVKIPKKGDYIFAEKKSIRQSEFYQAMTTGLKPELNFVIHTFEYNDESMLEYNGKTYKIIRTYEKDNEFIELTCQGVVNNATT